MRVVHNPARGRRLGWRERGAKGVVARRRVALGDLPEVCSVRRGAARSGILEEVPNVQLHCTRVPEVYLNQRRSVFAE